MIVNFATMNGIGDIVMSQTVIHRLVEANPGLEPYLVYKSKRRREDGYLWHGRLNVNSPYPVTSFRDKPFEAPFLNPQYETFSFYQHRHIIEHTEIEAASRLQLSVNQTPISKPVYWGEFPTIGYPRIGIHHYNSKNIRGCLSKGYKHWRHGEALRDRIQGLCKIPVEFSPWPGPSEKKKLIDWLASCLILITPEGGIYHLASALGTPTILILGDRMTQRQVGYNSTLRVLNSHTCPYGFFPCGELDMWYLPCRKGFKENKLLPCVEEITLSDVFLAFWEVLCEDANERLRIQILRHNKD